VLLSRLRMDFAIVMLWCPSRAAARLSSRPRRPKARARWRSPWTFLVPTARLVPRQSRAQSRRTRAQGRAPSRAALVIRRLRSPRSPCQRAFPCPRSLLGRAQTPCWGPPHLLRRHLRSCPAWSPPRFRRRRPRQRLSRVISPWWHPRARPSQLRSHCLRSPTPRKLQ